MYWLMSMFHKSWIWRCQTNNVGPCVTCGWTDPTWDMVLAIHNMYALSLDLRLMHVLKMWIDLLRGYQTLYRNWAIINVAFGFLEKHAVSHGWSRWDLPFSSWERYLWARRVIGSSMAMLGLSVNQGFRITASRKRGHLGARPNIVRQRE